jgi:CUE domain
MDTEEQIDTLHQLFPTLSRDIIASCLLEHDNKVAPTVETLRELTQQPGSSDAYARVRFSSWKASVQTGGRDRLCTGEPVCPELMESSGSSWEAVGYGCTPVTFFHTRVRSQGQAICLCLEPCA